MTTVKQYIKDVLTAFDPTLDISESSTLTDLLINPGSAILEPLIAQLNFIVANLGMQDPETLNNDELDQVASNFFITRNVGSKASGYVELYYNNAINLFIPAGTKFTTSNGLAFLTAKEYYIPSDVMAQNLWNYPRVSSGPITVIAEKEGTEYAVQPGTITSTALSPAPAQVSNPGSFSGGTDSETNTEFVQRLIDEIVTGALGSPSSIQTTLKKNFPSIQRVVVKGMNDNEMIRDLVASGISLESFYTNIDFYGKTSGLDDLPYPESSALWALFYDDPTTSGLTPDLPQLVEFTDEFSNDQYVGLYKLNDALKTTIQTLVILEEHFEGDLPAHWSTTDALQSANKLLRYNEIQIIAHGGSNKLQMGLKVTNANVEREPAPVLILDIYDYLNNLKRVSRMNPGVADWQPEVTDYSVIETINDELKDIV